MKMHDPKANCSWQSLHVVLEYLQMQQHLTGSEGGIPTKSAFGRIEVYSATYLVGLVHGVH